MKCGVEIKTAVTVEVWIDKRSDMGFEFRMVTADMQYRAGIRLPNGQFMWQWFKTKKEAEDWLKPWLTQKG